MSLLLKGSWDFSGWGMSRLNWWWLLTFRTLSIMLVDQLTFFDHVTQNKLQAEMRT